MSSPGTPNRLDALHSAGLGREALASSLTKKRTLIEDPKSTASNSLPTPSSFTSLQKSSPAYPLKTGLLSSAILSSGDGGGALSPLCTHVDVRRELTQDAEGIPISPHSSTTPYSVTPSEAVPMPRRKCHKKFDAEAASSIESQVRRVDLLFSTV